MMPIFSAILVFISNGRRIDFPRAIGLSFILFGAITLAGANIYSEPKTLFGDLLFLCASIMASIYTIRAGRLGLNAVQGAGIVCVYSMIGYSPVCFLRGSIERLWEAPTHDIIFQAVYQGVLMGAVSMIAFNKAIGFLGATTTSAFVSLVPVIASLVAIPVLNEVPSPSDILAIAAISGGVLAATGALSRWPCRT
jgi:drug/metabolite transporter (DMT)-like permease